MELQVHVEENVGASEPRFPEWACQRSTPLKHQNDFLAVRKLNFHMN